MKNSIFILGLALAAVAAQSCSEDNSLNPEPAPIKPGTEIRFGAKLDDKGVTSRTVYGEETVEGDKTVWPIYWNYPSPLDEVFIYSPQALTGRNQAKYQVKPEKADQTIASQIEKTGSFGIQASDASTYDFYGFYPASSVSSSKIADGTSIYGNLSPMQSVEFAGTAESPTSVIPSTPDGTSAYLTSPDMKNCIMVAENKGVQVSDDTSVNLIFTPFASVLDITLPGAQETNTITGSAICHVTSVDIVADAPIAGDFSYDFNTKTITFGDNKTNEITVSTLGYNTDNDLVGIPMTLNNSLRLQAFILPNPDVKDIKVVIHTSDSQVWTKTLNVTNFKVSQIHKVILPKLKLNEDDFDYSRWISQLDPRIYISELSLPGSTSSFSYKLGEGNSDRMQNLDLAQQFNAGIRVFRCHVWLYPGTGIDGGDTHFGINVGGSAEIISLSEVVNTLAEEMKDSRGNEFCVLMVADYQHNKTYDAQTFYNRFKSISNYLQENAITAENINANTTIGDVKGKVILKLQLNGDGYGNNGVANTTDRVNDLLNKIQTWTEVDDSEALFNWWTPANGSELFYAPMFYGKTGTFEYTPFSNTLNPFGSGTKGTVTVTNNNEGIATLAAQRIIAKSTGNGYGSAALGGYSSNINATAVPSDADLGNINNMYYIYGAQSNAGANMSAASNLIDQAVNAISTTYPKTNHNCFYMTYLGGSASGDNTIDVISTQFITKWNGMTNVNPNNGTVWGAKPFGWVLFNRIPEAGKDVVAGTVDELVKKGIQKVISQNNDIQFKLKRNYEKTVVQESPAGDVTGTPSGGAIF